MRDLMLSQKSCRTLDLCDVTLHRWVNKYGRFEGRCPGYLLSAGLEEQAKVKGDNRFVHPI